MKKIIDANIENKRIIVRCDLNVPIEDGIIKDDTRIVESLDTLKYVIKMASQVVILSHLGRVKNEDDKIKNTLYPVCTRLEELLDEKIYFYDYENDIDLTSKIIMFENTRFFDLDNKKESNNDIELSKYFASFGDIFINDAFGVSHRECASNVGISKYLPSYIGFLMEKEIENLDKVRNNPNKPFTIILGGSKVSDKIGVISNLIDKADKLIIVGAMAFTFLKAKGYEIGKSIVDLDNISYASNLLNKYSDKIILPVDVYVHNGFKDEKGTLKDINSISYNEIGLDIGPKTINLISENISDSKTIFLNGPAGAFELSNYSYGTKELLNILSKIDGDVIIGGGDSAYAAVKFGYKDSFTHISTGGGASLEYLEGRELPGIKYLCD